MLIKLTDDEIREALAESLAKKLSYTVQPDPDDGWFEFSAKFGEGVEVSGIGSVRFCYDTDSKKALKGGEDLP